MHADSYVVTNSDILDVTSYCAQGPLILKFLTQDDQIVSSHY